MRRRGSPIEYKPVRWEYDLYANKFVPRYSALPAPLVGIFDEPHACAVINLEWLSHILGMLEVLLQRDSWAGDEAEIYRAQQEIEKLLFSLKEPCADDMREIELRTILTLTGCNQNQWKYTDEPNSEWRNLGQPVCSGQDGQNGTNGIDGVCPECDETPPLPEPTTLPPGQDEKCLAAAAMTKAVRDALENTTNNIALGGDLVSAGGAFAAFLGVFLVGWVVVAGAAFALLGAIINVFASGGEVVFTEDDWNELICIFFCRLPQDARLDQASFDQVVADAMAKKTESFEWEFIANTVSIFGVEGLNNAARAVLVTSANCAGCDTCDNVIRVYANIYNDGLGVDSQIDVSAGQCFNFAANDLWNPGDGNKDANGSGSYLWQNYVLPYQPLGILIGRVGTSGSWFPIGKSATINMTTSGRLYLMCNDIPGAHNDNSGYQDVSITPC